MESSSSPFVSRNIILFLGDGMGVSTVTAARIFEGQRQGGSGEENRLTFEKFPNVALAKTYNTNQQTPDSAGTMTAIMAGIKTRAGLIGVNQNARRADCASSLDNHEPSFMQQAAASGFATGVVTTTRITHATPAAVFAHAPEREWEVDSSMPAAALAEGCRDIASQLIDFDHGNGINVALGGGLRYFLPESRQDPVSGEPGRRQDGRDLTLEWQELYENSAFVRTSEQLQEAVARDAEHVLGLFHPSHMSYDVDRRQDERDIEPSLSEMTAAAINLLQKRANGFFLMVEGGRIDHGHHASNAYRALDETIEFSSAVETALSLTDSEDTLIIVTADHSHTLTIAGYPTRGNSILGTVIGNDESGEPRAAESLDADGLPYTTLGYRDGPGFARSIGGDLRYERPHASGRHDLRDVHTQHPDFHQESLIPLNMETHAGEGVAIYAKGPWAHLFRGVHEQNYIYFVMRHASGLDDAH